MLTTGSPTSSHHVAGCPLSPPPEPSRQSSSSSHSNRSRSRSRPPSWSHHPGNDGVFRSSASLSVSSSRSPLMSSDPQKHESSIPTTTQSPPAQTSLALAPSAAASLSSPPSSLAMSAQNSQHPTSTTNSFPTPASSVSGQMATAAPEEAEGAAATKDPSTANVEVTKQRGDPSIKNESSPDSMEIDAIAPPEASSKQAITDAADRKVTENAMELDPKEPKPTGDQSLTSLQPDMGQAFHVCKTSYSISGPDPSLDLVSLYGLGSVARSVARINPITGDKNRLRKSYEGKIKELGLAGRNKAVRHEPGTPGGLRQLTMWPEEEWQNQKVYGKEIKVAEPDSNAHKMQMRAMKFEPGPVPNNEYWESVLGHEKQPKSSGDQSRKSSTTTTTFQQPSQANGTPAATAAAAADPGRPKRAGKKRSYTDDSFVGYADAFPEDDDLEGSLYSNSEGGSSKKKRKKDHLSGVPPSLNDRGGSYGVGMFGVGAR